MQPLVTLSVHLNTTQGRGSELFRQKKKSQNPPNAFPSKIREERYSFIETSLNNTGMSCDFMLLLKLEL